MNITRPCACAKGMDETVRVPAPNGDIKQASNIWGPVPGLYRCTDCGSLKNLTVPKEADSP